MAENTFLTYKGKPLVRKDNEIYYGDTSEKFIVKFTILSTAKDGNLDIADKVKIELLKSDLSEKDTKIKESTKDTLFDALDLGFTWLERALKD